MSTETLKGFSIFRGVQEPTLSRLGMHAAARTLAAGDDLFVAGDPRVSTWFVRSGWVRIRVHSPGGHEATAEIIGPGEAFGCPMNEGLECYPYTATALTDVSAVTVSSAALERWLHAEPHAAALLAKTLGMRLVEITQLKAINAERAPVRLQLTLSWLVRKLGTRLPATRGLLADLTGLRAETCSRVLSTLRRRGVLKVAPGLIHVLRPAELDAAARLA